MARQESAPSVSSISRVLRGGGHGLESELGQDRPSHSIDGILGRRGMRGNNQPPYRPPSKPTGHRGSQDRSEFYQEPESFNTVIPFISSNIGIPRKQIRPQSAREKVTAGETGVGWWSLVSQLPILITRHCWLPLCHCSHRSYHSLQY